MLGCFNARSICNKTVGVLEMIKDHNISICCVTETWLKNSDKAKFAEIHDAQFDVFNSPRKGRGGGVGFIFDPSRINPIRNNVKSHSSFEALECIINSVQKPIRLCTIYRSTQSKGKYEETKMTKFLEEFEEYLDSLVQKTGIPVICGDFNIHVEDITNMYAQKFKFLYESKGFIQHVEGPTHNSGGTLDLVLTLKSVSDALHVSDMVVDPSTGTASDHYLIKFEVPVAFKNSSARSYEEKEVREYKNICVDKFREDLFTSAINQVEFECLDHAVSLYTDTVSSILDKHAPLITKRFTVQKSDFWDEKCQAAKRNRQRAKRRLKKAKQTLHDNPLADIDIEEIRADHHEKSVDAAITINRARDNFYRKQLESYKGDAKGTYKVINKLLDREYGSNKVPNGEDQDVANRLKDFFHSKVKNIYSGITAENDSLQFMNQPPQLNPAAKSSFCEFSEVSMSDLESIIRSMPNKSSSLDAIPLWLFKECLPEMLPITHYIVNQSLMKGVFPEDLKLASIRPGLKKPTLDVDELKNYRPISNLTYLSKILEKVVHDQLNTYVTTNGLYAKFQSGYRKHHSCETAVTRIHNDILMLIDKKTNVLLLLLDLSAAFDTINHSLLLQKLKHSFGVTNIVLKWLTSYLRNRKFKVSIKKGTSEECILEIGVPQGSILGPLLFILYTADLEMIVKKYGFDVHLYADDTQVYFAFDVHSKDPDLNAIKLCFKEIKQWMSRNFLKLNEDKTELLDVGPYVSPISSLDLGGFSITPVQKAKNLGFYFDHRMSLDAQISSVSQICYINQRNLSRIGSKLSHELKIQLVYSNILCFIDYCNAVYQGLTEKSLQKLQKIENNAVRFIFGLYGKRWKENITPYLKQLHFLPVRYRIKFKIALLVYKCINNLAPDYLKGLLKLREIKRRVSRLDDDFFLLKVPPKSNFSRTEAAFCYTGPQIWNGLPFSIRSISVLQSFKTALKTYFFNLAFSNGK